MGFFMRQIAGVAAIFLFVGCQTSGCQPNDSQSGGRQTVRDDSQLPAQEQNETATLPQVQKTYFPSPEEKAIESFQSQALTCIAVLRSVEAKKFATDQINDRAHLGCQRVTAKACFERMDSTLSPQERSDLILFGRIDDLRDRGGDCWDVCSFGGFGNSINGYLDVQTGKLLVLWIVPEG